MDYLHEYSHDQAYHTNDWIDWRAHSYNRTNQNSSNHQRRSHSRWGWLHGWLARLLSGFAAALTSPRCSVEDPAARDGSESISLYRCVLQQPEWCGYPRRLGDTSTMIDGCLPCSHRCQPWYKLQPQHSPQQHGRAQRFIKSTIILAFNH